MKSKPVIEIVTPRHMRPPDDPAPCAFPGTDWLRRVGSMTPSERREFGLRPWGGVGLEDSQPGDPVLWLLPGEWYQYIPDGEIFTDIMGHAEVFVRGASDDDTRHGCLPYGILCDPEPTE